MVAQVGGITNANRAGSHRTGFDSLALCQSEPTVSSKFSELELLFTIGEHFRYLPYDLVDIRSAIINLRFG